MKKGFTLVELVIVIAIVIVLSVVSVPIYRSYVDKAKMAEGYALLGTILSAQKAYYSEYGNFFLSIHGSAGSAKRTNYETVLGIDARGNKYFTWFFVNDLNGMEKYYFDSGVHLPEDLKNGDNVDLLLQYNLTKGAKIGRYPADYDHSLRNN